MGDDVVEKALDTLRLAAANIADPVSQRAVTAHLDNVKGLLNEAASRHRSQGKSSRQYNFGALLEALLLSRLIQNVKHLPEVMVRSLHYVFGPDLAAELQNKISQKSMKIPSESTISRSRLKLDPSAALIRSYGKGCSFKLDRFRRLLFAFLVLLFVVTITGTGAGVLQSDC